MRLPRAGVCLVDGCSNPRKARGLCSVHYGRALRYGNPLAPPGVKGGRPAAPPKICSIDGCEGLVQGPWLVRDSLRPVAPHR